MERCNLCRKKRSLIKKSHIIPDFFYRQSGIYNENHQVHKINVQEYLKTGDIKYARSGDYEGGILCAECDNKIIGKLESYSSKLLYGGLSPNEELDCKNYKNPNDGFEYSVCYNVDYARFKLFLLSILWRASISNREIFKEADIKKRHKRRIRKMILKNSPGKLTEYPIITLCYLKNKSMPRDLIFQPIKGGTRQKKLITFLIGGFVFIYNITRRYKKRHEIKEFSITPENKMTILHFPKGKEWDFILKYANII